MPPQQRFIPRFVAEPPQEGLPYGRWEERLRAEFLAGCLRLCNEEGNLGEPGAVVFYPDRGWHGRTYVPATSITSTGQELFGYVRFLAAHEGGDPSDFFTQVDFTEETATQNPDWKMDVCDEVIGSWRGYGGEVAAMTLVWGRPMISGGRVVTGELGEATVDQCQLIEERFTLIAPDDYRQELLEVKLWGSKGQELASESLYEGEQDEDDQEA